MVGRELCQQHPQDLLSSRDVPQVMLSVRPCTGQITGCCWHNSEATLIHPDQNRSKQLCIKQQNTFKISNNQATSPTCCYYDVIYLSLMTGIVAWHTLPWKVWEHEDHHKARKTVWPVNAGRVTCCKNQNNFYWIIIYHKHISGWFMGVSAAGLSIITINHIDTGIMKATGTQSPLRCMRLLDTRSW